MKDLKDSPNVVQIISTHYDDAGHFYVVMEYLEHSLNELIRDVEKNNHLFPPDFVMEVIFQLLTVLFMFSKKKVIHRNLVFSNIRFDSEKKLKIISFGLAFYNNSKQDRKKGEGPIELMPPEFFTNNIYTERYDLWAVGVIFLRIGFG